MKIYESLHFYSTYVDKKAMNKVMIPNEDWKISWSVEFIVALLKKHDAILGMSFLVEEGIVIDLD